MSAQWTVASVADALGGSVDGPCDGELTRVASIVDAQATDLTFLSNRRYAAHLIGCGAGAVLVTTNQVRPAGAPPYIRVADPYVAFARALALLHPLDWPEPGIQLGAHVADDAVVKGVFVDTGAVVSPGAVIGAGTWIEPGVVVGRDARVGMGCRLMANAVVAPRCVLGDRVQLNPGAVVGGDGYGFAPSAAGHVKIPQCGSVVVGDDVEVGANSCIDRSALPDTHTVVGKGSKLDNLVQVGHGAQLGKGVRMVAYSGVAGSSRLGDGVTLAAKAAVLGHREVGAGVSVGVASVVHDAPRPGARVSGVPAIDHRTWLRASVALRELPELLREVRALRRRVAALEAEMHRSEAGADD